MLVSGLLKIGYIVKLIVNNSSHKDSILLNKFSKLNIEIVELGEESKSRWKKILKFRSIVLSYNPQIILCCNFYLNILGYLSFLPKSIKVASWIRFQLTKEVLNQKAIFYNLGFKWQDALIFNSL